MASDILSPGVSAVTSGQISTIGNRSYTVLLSTAMVDVRDVKGHYQQDCVLFDSGSMANFISLGCVTRLGLSHGSMSVQ